LLIRPHGEDADLHAARDMDQMIALGGIEYTASGMSCCRFG
jgi:hypothetical protein